MKWRYIANSYAYMVTIPTNALAAKIAYTFQQTPVKWRGSFYFMIGVNALSALCWFLFCTYTFGWPGPGAIVDRCYRPPTNIQNVTS